MYKYTPLYKHIRTINIEREREKEREREREREWEKEEGNEREKHRERDVYVMYMLSKLTSWSPLTTTLQHEWLWESPALVRREPALLCDIHREAHASNMKFALAHISVHYFTYSCIWLYMGGRCRKLWFRDPFWFYDFEIHVDSMDFEFNIGSMTRRGREQDGALEQGGARE